MSLATIRSNQNVTQQALADSVGITRQMVSAIENGAKPSVETAKAIATELVFDWTRFFEDPPGQPLDETIRTSVARCRD